MWSGMSLDAGAVGCFVYLGYLILLTCHAGPANDLCA